LADLDEISSSLDTALDESKFVFLDVGTSYVIEQEFSVLNQDEKGNPLQPGSHVLQVVVPTWYYPSVSNIEWREKWRQGRPLV
jgi:hypothetical protein